MSSSPQPLQRRVGLVFGVAMAFGGTVGVGILRLPGEVASALGDPRLVVLFWILGGLYALLGAVAVAELAAMFPQAGGFYVYARRAFGNFSFVVGWSDWFNNVASLAFQAITAATFLGALLPATAGHPRVVAIAVVATFTGLHWLGLRVGSNLTRVISLGAASMLLLLALACFFLIPAADSAPVAPSAATSVAGSPLLSLAMFAASITALRAILVTFDGWNSPIYMAEESTHPSRNLPRAIVGGALLIGSLYLLINIAFLRVLPFATLAASKLPAADAARLMLPQGGPELITAIAFITLLSIFNAGILGAPRILLAIGRDGFFLGKATEVSASGTPRVALAVTSLAITTLILTGTFEQILTLAALFFMLNYISTYAALIVLRIKEPQLPRPFRAVGYPFTTLVVLTGSILFLIGAVVADPVSAVVAALLLVGGCTAAWAVQRWGRSRREAAAAGL